MQTLLLLSPHSVYTLPPRGGSSDGSGDDSGNARPGTAWRERPGHRRNHHPDEDSQTWALSIPIRLADSHKLISYSPQSSIMHRPKEAWEAGEAQSESQLQRGGSARHSAQRSSAVASFCLRDSRRQPVIVPVAVAVLHGLLVFCCVAEVRSDPPWCDDEGMQTKEQAKFSITYTLHPFQEQKWCQYLYYQPQSDQSEKENEQSKTELTDSPHQSR